jgi:hypothetical protein
VPSASPSGSNFGDGAWVWEYHGTIISTSAEAFAQQLANNTRNALKPRSPPDQAAPIPPRIRSYGAYFYPPIEIGKMSKLSFRQRTRVEPEASLIFFAFFQRDADGLHGSPLAISLFERLLKRCDKRRQIVDDDLPQNIEIN